MTSISDQYEKIDRLGEGAFGKVQKVRRVTDGMIFACKVIKLKKYTNLDDAENECRLLRGLQHPNIVRYIDYESSHLVSSTLQRADSRPAKLRLFMEYCPEGSLQDLIESNKSQQTFVTEMTAWQVIHQVASALRYCHYGTRADGFTERSWRPVLHRDIKPANVLVYSRRPDRMITKLADFGLAKVMNPESPLNSYAGTHLYQPPEITRSNSQGIEWTKACDIFSLGCTVYELCSLAPPFAYRMEEQDECPNLPSRYSARLNACISRCLALNPGSRHDAFMLLHISESIQGCTEDNTISFDGKVSALNTELDSIALTDVATPKQRHSPSELRLPASTDTLNNLTEPNDTHSADTLTPHITSQHLQTVRSEEPRPKVIDFASDSNDWAEFRDLMSTGKALFKADRLLDASSTFGKALNIINKIGGPETTDNAECLCWLGRAQIEQEKYSMAEEMLQEASRVYTADDPNGKSAAASLFQLGRVQRLQSKFAEAESTFRRALVIHGNQKEDDLSLARCVFWIGEIQFVRGENLKAEHMLKEALRIYVVHDATGKLTADCLLLLGNAQRLQSKIAEAETSCREALELYNRLGSESRETAICVNRLGIICSQQKKHSEAEKAFQRAMDIFTKLCLGGDMTAIDGVCKCAFSLGLAQDAQGKYPQAESTFRHLLHIRGQAGKPKDKDSADCLYWLGQALLGQKKYVEAETTYRSSLEIFDKMCGRVSQETSDCLYALGRTLIEQGKHVEAEMRFRSAIEIMKMTNGLENQTAAARLYMLGRVSLEQNKFAQAEATFQNLFGIFTRLNGLEHNNTADCLYGLGYAQYRQSDPNAYSTLRLARDIFAMLDGNHDHYIKLCDEHLYSLSSQTPRRI